MTAIGFEQAKADPCVFRKVADGEAEMVVVVHVDDNLAHAKDQATTWVDSRLSLGRSSN